MTTRTGRALILLGTVFLVGATGTQGVDMRRMADRLQGVWRVRAEGCVGEAVAVCGKCFVTGGYADGTVLVWDVETGKELRQYQGHTATVTCVAFFPDGKRIVSTSHDGTARIWRVPR